MSSSVARRYGRALVELAEEHSLLSETAGQLNGFGQALDSIPELRSALENPGFTPAERRNVVIQLLSGDESTKIVRNFLCLLVDNGRMAAFDEILASVTDQVDSRLGRVRAHVSSAIALDPATIDTLKEQIRHLTGKDEVLLATEVDPALIGGIVTRVGDLVFDGSIRTQLSNFRNQLLGSSIQGEA